MAQLSIIELIVRRTSVQLNIAEAIVEKIIQHKHKAVHDAQYLHNTVEDSGLGTFKVRTNVAIKRLARIERDLNWLENELQDGTLTEKKRATHLRSIDKILEEKKYLESKI